MTARRQTVALAEARDESEFGGKAVGLGDAIRAGLPVPDGVALSATLVAALAAGERAAVAELNAVHRSLPGPLAVRSSCVGEDSAAASFAGQHLTRLNVRTLRQLTDAVAAVWRSGCSHSALAYRRKLGLESTPRMGVVVQRLLDPDVSGVLFTRHPVTGADERIIEATWGLGEAVVQGLVAPDRYRLSASGEVLERTPGDKRIAIRPRADGLAATELVAAHRVHALCLDDRRLACLHALARDCENAFRAPSDIEWAFTDAGPQLLQRRAITSTTTKAASRPSGQAPASTASCERLHQQEDQDDHSDDKGDYGDGASVHRGPPAVGKGQSDAAVATLPRQPDDRWLRTAAADPAAPPEPGDR